jgi:hypothetical protein
MTGTAATGLVAGAGPVRAAAISARRAPSTRYVTQNGAGLEDGSSWANAAALSDLDAQIGLAGPGGQIVVAGGADLTGAVTVTNGGASADSMVTIKAVDPDTGDILRTRWRGDRTAPWPNLTARNSRGDWAPGVDYAVGDYAYHETGIRLCVEAHTSAAAPDDTKMPLVAADGSRTPLVHLDAGWGWLNFQGFTFADCFMAFRFNADGVGFILGDPTFHDSLVYEARRKFREEYPFWNRASPAAVAAADRINTLLQSSLTAEQLEAQEAASVCFSNVSREWDTGANSDTTVKVDHVRIYGGESRGIGRGARSRGAGSDHWHQDFKQYGEKQRAADGFFSMLHQFDGTVSDSCFLRCHAEGSYHSNMTGYLNGDGFVGERGNSATDYFGCTSRDHVDGCIETKAQDVIVIGGTYDQSRRLLRLWGSADVYNATCLNPRATAGGSPCVLYSSSGDMVRMHGTCLIDMDVANGAAVFVADTNSFMAYSADVAIRQGSGRLRQPDSSSMIVPFNPEDRTPAAVTSPLTAELEEASNYAYSPTADKPGRWYLDGGPDADLIYIPRTNDNTFRSSARTIDAPDDADADNVYEYGARFYTPQGAATDVTMRFEVVPAANVSTGILTSMAEGDVPPDPELNEIYRRFIGELTDSGILLRAEFIFVASHDEGPAKLSWGRELKYLQNDGRRPMPEFTAHEGWRGSSANWCYIREAENEYARASSGNCAMAMYLRTANSGNNAGLANTGISTNDSAQAVIRPHHRTPITLPGRAFPGLAGWDRKGSEVRGYVGDTRVYDGISTPTGASRGRMRFGSIDGLRGGSNNDIWLLYYGMSLGTDARWAALHRAVESFRTAIDAYR